MPSVQGQQKRSSWHHDCCVLPGMSPQSALQMLAAHHLLLHWHAGVLPLDFSKAFRSMFVELGLEYSAIAWPVWMWELGLPRLRTVSDADALGPISASDNAAAGAQGRTRCSGSRHACSCYMMLLLPLLGCEWQTVAFGVLYGSVSVRWAAVSLQCGTALEQQILHADACAGLRGC